MSALLPTLSGDGWIKNPGTILTTSFAYFLLSEFSQSTIYYGNISSLPYLVAKYQDDLTEMQTQLETTLRNYYNHYFSVVNISVRYYDVVAQKYKLEIVINVTANEKIYNLANVFDINGGILTNVLNNLNQ